MLIYDETPVLAARARTVAKAVLGLLLEEQRAARFVYDYSSLYFRQGIEGEAEHKAEFLSAIERESLLLIAARIERELPRAPVLLSSGLSEPEAIAAFRQAFLTYLGGSLAWDSDEREAFRKDLAMYLRLAARESRAMVHRPGAAQIGGAFVDRCAFLLDPSMLAQAREAAARFQVQLESCAGEALRAAFGSLRPKPAPVLHQIPRPVPAPTGRSEPEQQRKPRQPAKRRLKPKLKPRRTPKPRPKSRPKPRPKAKPARVSRQVPQPSRKRIPKRRPKPRIKPKSRPKTASEKRRVTLPARAKGKSLARRRKAPSPRKPSQSAKPAKRSGRSARKAKRSRAKR